MKTLLVLLKTNFINIIGINKLLKQKKGKLILYSFLALFLACYLLSISSFYAWLAANYLSKYNLISFMLTIFFALGYFSTFIFTIYNAKAGLFSANDNDMLFSMPIKPRTILASRLLNLTITNLVAALIIVGPAMVVYALRVDVSIAYYISCFFTFILLPVIPTILACLIGYFIAYLTSKSNVKNWFEMITSFIFILAIFLVSAFANRILTFITTDMETIVKILKYGFYPIYLVNNLFTENNYLSLFLYILINLGLLFAFIFVLQKSYRSIIAKLQENKTRSNYVIKTLKGNSINKALFIKEIKRYFSSPIYVLNTSFGVLLILIMAVASIFYDKDKILSVFDLNQLSITPFMMIVLMVTFVIFMSNTTAAAISIEGKNFWIIKSLPVSIKKIFNGKLLVNIMVVLPITLISIIILKFTFALTIIQMLISMLLAIITTIVVAQFGLLVNLKFPKMDAVSDVVVVKQSLSTVISIMVPMVLIFMVAGIYGELGSQLNFNTFILILLAFYIVVLIVERILLNTWGIKRFNEIN